MTQGVFHIKQGKYERIKYKKLLEELVKSEPENIMIEDTSLFGNNYKGVLTDIKHGIIYIVGPDPHNNRKWYASITKTKEGFKVT